MSKTELATLAGGCFWCTEAIFQRLRGINRVTPGYAGGNMARPTYEQVSNQDRLPPGKQGHVESIQFEFDPRVISYKKLLDIFWHTHNPTTIDRQGNDRGPQYRSIIFYHNLRQKREAEKSKIDLEKENIYPDPIVTEIRPYTDFCAAEDYHKNYYERHRGSDSYCDLVIGPKIHKLLEKYGRNIEPEYKQVEFLI